MTLQNSETELRPHSWTDGEQLPPGPSPTDLPLPLPRSLIEANQGCPGFLSSPPPYQGDHQSDDSTLSLSLCPSANQHQEVKGINIVSAASRGTTTGTRRPRPRHDPSPTNPPGLPEARPLPPPRLQPCLAKPAVLCSGAADSPEGADNQTISRS